MQDVSEASRGPILGLEAIRAIAALTVLAGHIYTKVDGFPRSRAFDFITNYATEAVVAFFVLSGVVLTLKARDAVGPYLVARCLRIMPIYYLSLAMTLLVSLGTGIEISAGQVLGNALFLQNLAGDIVSPPAANMALWSLSYEMMFYLAFPIVLMGARRREKLFLALLASLAVGLLLPKIHVGIGPADFFISVFGFYCLWLLGAVTNDLTDQGIHISAPTAITLLGVGLALSRVSVSKDFYDIFRLFSFACGICAICWLITQKAKGIPARRMFDMPFAHRTLIVGVAIALLLLTSKSATVTKAVLSAAAVSLLLVSTFWTSLNGKFRHFTFLRGPAAYLGSISYAVYAVHMPILYALEPFSEVTGLLRGVLTFVITFALAHVLERWLQPKIARALQQPRPDTKLAKPQRPGAI